MSLRMASISSTISSAFCGFTLYRYEHMRFIALGLPRFFATSFPRSSGNPNAFIALTNSFFAVAVFYFAVRTANKSYRVYGVSVATAILSGFNALGGGFMILFNYLQSIK